MSLGSDLAEELHMLKLFGPANVFQLVFDQLPLFILFLGHFRLWRSLPCSANLLQMNLVSIWTTCLL